jgi:hypothetical protein
LNIDNILIANLKRNTREEHKLRVFENRVLEENIWTKEGWSNGRVEKAA